MKIFLGVSLLGLASLLARGADGADSPLADRVGATGFIQLKAESFSKLPARQQELAYWLAQASIAIDPIFYDQASAAGLREKRLLEEIVAHASALDAAARPKLENFAKHFWANRGNHDLSTSRKFTPDFSPDELRAAAVAAFNAGAFRTRAAGVEPLATQAAVEAEVADLHAPLFDANFEPMLTAKSPDAGKDLIQSSANTYYGVGVTLADLKAFPAKHALNSRVVKGADGQLSELVYRAGTPDGQVAPGLYATFLQHAIDYLRRAQAVAEPAQADVIAKLIRYYETGEYADLIAFDSAWVQDDAPVDFANNFIEIYRDAIGAKGSSQSFVCITDATVTRAMKRLAENAAYFEKRAPWLDVYKRTDFRAPVVKAVEVLIETGDFEVSTIGDNLPNENEVREQFGSKNFLFTGSAHAIEDAVGQAGMREFYATPEIVARQEKYGSPAEDMLTALHEVIGHGSGKLSDRLKGGSESVLKEYFSTLEEARADLMGLWNIWDPKLKELGLVDNQEEIAKAMYDRAALNIIYQLRNIPAGNTIEEDHLRDRALITNYIMEKTGAIRVFDRGGKTYIEITDYQKMRAGAGQLLAELMRIKAEGDYDAIKALVDRYAVHFDPKLRDQVIARYKRLDLPTYWAGLNVELTAAPAGNGEPPHITSSYPRDTIHQYLSYAAMYNAGLGKK